MIEQAEAGRAYYAREPIGQRIWRALGFYRGHAPRPTEDELADGWAPSWLIVESDVHLDFRNRLRILVSGRLLIEHVIKTDVTIGRSDAVSAIGVMPPRRGR